MGLQEYRETKREAGKDQEIESGEQQTSINVLFVSASGTMYSRVQLLSEFPMLRHDMPFLRRISLTSVFGSALMFCYVVGLIFGNGLHLHESLTHGHDGAGSHSHAWSVHVHSSEIGLSALSLAGIGNPDHDHDVASVALLAVPASVSTPKLSNLNQVRAPACIQPPPTPDFLLPLLFAVPRETSPPLFAITDRPVSGRSPPFFS